MSINSLLHAFPSVVESYYDFKENDREISRRAIPGIIKYAFHHSIIETDSEAAFVAFLEKYGKTDLSDKLPEGLTFSDVLNTLSGNLSVNALIAQLEVTARELSLPEVQATMITRLKKFVINTPKAGTPANSGIQAGSETSRIELALRSASAAAHFCRRPV